MQPLLPCIFLTVSTNILLGLCMYCICLCYYYDDHYYCHNHYLSIIFQFDYSILMISTFMIVVKFIFQTSFFSQYLSNGVWKIAGLVKEVSETIFVPDPFQWIHVIGIYKTASEYVCNSSYRNLI